MSEAYFTVSTDTQTGTQVKLDFQFSQVLTHIQI